MKVIENTCNSSLCRLSGIARLPSGRVSIGFFEQLDMRPVHDKSLQHTRLSKPLSRGYALRPSRIKRMVMRMQNSSDGTPFFEKKEKYPDKSVTYSGL